MAYALAEDVERDGLSASAEKLACLVMVGRSYGLSLTVAQLVRDNLLGGSDLSMAQWLGCARRAGFRCTLVTLDWPGLMGLGAAVPAIALTRGGSAMVVTGTAVRDGVPVVVLREPGDPEIIRELDEAAFAALATGEIILVRPRHEERVDAQPFGFRLIATLMLGDRRRMAEMMVSALTMSVLALTPIVFWTLLGSTVLPNHAAATFTFLCAAAVVLVLFEGAFGALRRHVLVRLTMQVDRELSAFMFDRLLGLSIEVFETTPVGAITHTIAQMAKVRAFLTGQLFGALLDAGVLIVFLPVMAFVSPLMTLIVVAFCAAIAGWLLLMLPVYHRRSSAVETAEAERGAFLSETISGIRTVRTMALDDLRTDRWDALTARSARLRLAEADLRNVIQTVVAPLERLSLSGTVAAGALVAITSSDTLGVGALLTFIMLTQRVAAPLLQLSTLVQQYDEARNAVDQVAALLNQPAEEGRSGYGVRTPIVGEIDVAGVQFSYRGAAAPALREVSFAVHPGMSFGIMGRSGSGKTTITRLLQRLHADYQGTIRIDGIDVRDYDVDHLRASLGVVLQDNFLFSGTIRDNIAAGRSDASLEEVVRAARLAGAEEFIDKLPGGYETVIYEGSPNLSGGQRQRIAIARALITDPKILILDEATSALDAESESIVNASLRRIAEGRTTMIISHRLSSLVACDAILVLDGGEVKDIGTHRELLARSDLYAGLWARQTAHAAQPEERGVARLMREARG